MLAPKQRRPWLTWVACTACALVFLAILTEPREHRDVALAHLGWQPPGHIYSGHYWALVTPVFVHISFFYLIGNLYWLYRLGKGLEQTLGWWRWLGFVIGAAVVGSGAGLALSNDTGIGVSGVNSAMFAFMWIARKRVRKFARVLDPRTAITFVIWLGVCLILNQAKVWAFGTFPQFAGLLYGMTLAAWVLDRPRRPLISAAIAVLLAAALLPVFWAPWSKSWTSWRGVSAYEKEDFPTAIQWFERSLSRGHHKAWCLQRIALSYGRMNDEAGFRKAVERLREADEVAAEELERAFIQPAP